MSTDILSVNPSKESGTKATGELLEELTNLSFGFKCVGVKGLHPK